MSKPKREMSTYIHGSDSDEDPKADKGEVDGSNALLNRLSGSWLGSLFKIQYQLRVFVKHDQLLKFGAGDYVTFPIRILSEPFVETSQEPFRVPENWNPISVNSDIAYLY